MRIREILYEMPMAEYATTTDKVAAVFRDYGYDIQFGFGHVKDRAATGYRGDQLDAESFKSTFMSLLNGILRGNFDDIWEEARKRSQGGSREDRSVSVVLKHAVAKLDNVRMMINVPSAFFYFGKIPTIKVLTVMVKDTFRPRPNDTVVNI